MTVEERISLLNAMMCALLGRSALRDDDSFFACGGNSLLAARLAASLSSGLGVDVSVKEIFEHQTPNALGEHIQGAPPSGPPPTPADRPEVIPLAPAQGRLWFQNRLFPGDASYNMSVAMRIDGPVDISALRGAVLDVVERHEVLRTVYPDWDGQPQQLVLTTEEAGISLLGPLDADPAGNGVAVVATHAGDGFDVTTEPPLRALLVREADDCHVLGFVIHHIACDGWSLAPLLNDIKQAYRFRTGHGPRPAPLALQYVDYALWAQRHLLGAGPGVRELDYWLGELGDPPAVPTLEGMRPREGSPSGAGGELTRHLSKNLHKAVVSCARRLSASPFMVVHAALVVAIQRMGGHEDCIVGTPVAGRPDPALDGLVGFFVNTLALRVDASGNPSFEALVARVRAADLAALAHDRVPFDKILQELNPPRQGGWVPLVGIMLAYQNTARAGMNLPGVRCEALAVPSRAARFDLRLEVVEHEGDGTQQGIELHATWAEQVASEGVAERLVALVHQVLREATENPARRIRRLGRSDGIPPDAPPLPAPGRFPIDRSGHSRLAMVCSPFGQQWAGMGLRLLEQEPVFAEAVDDCANELSRYVSWDVRQELERGPRTSRVDDVTVGQPLVFVIQIALARWFESRGVLPTVVTGHSIGEIAAGAIADMLSLSDAVQLLFHYTRVQGRLVSRGGGMMLVEATSARLNQILSSLDYGAVVIATENGPRTSALAGPRTDLERLKSHLESRRYLCAWIRVDVAAHGPDIDEILPDLVGSIGSISPRAPRVPIISSVTGSELDWRLSGPAYFARNLRRRVRFSKAIETILTEPTGALIEVSANPILGPALAQCIDEADSPTHVLATMRRTDGDDRAGPLRVVDWLRGSSATHDLYRP